MLVAISAVGHIPGTLPRALPRISENHRDLNRRSDRMRGALAVVRATSAQDPAYRPTHPLASAEAGSQARLDQASAESETGEVGAPPTAGFSADAIQVGADRTHAD